MTMQHQNLRLEIKALGPREFEGYGSIFSNVDHGGDVVLPGAFAKSISEHKANDSMPLMFWMHQSDQVPGVWTDMAEDAKGLYVKGEIVDTALGRDVRTLLQKNAVRGLSIGYRPVDIDWRTDGTRLLKQLELLEVSIVSMAMNPLARVEAMKAARLSADGEYVPTEREFEQHFRRMGCSKSVARLLIARVFDGDDAGGMPGGHRWDAGNAEDEEQLLEAMERLTDKFGAASLQRV
jgi:HK97 family phage prohead protease